MLDAEPFAHWRECFRQHRLPLGVHSGEPLLELGTVPGERLQLEPELLVRAILVQVGHRRPPLLEERHVRRVHPPLSLDQRSVKRSSTRTSSCSTEPK